MDKITCSVRDAMTMSGLGKTKLHELMADGRVASVKIDGKRLVRVDSLQELLSYNPVHKSNPDLGEPRRTTAGIERETVKEYQRKANLREPPRT
jgi:hypothetical protein